MQVRLIGRSVSPVLRREPTDSVLNAAEEVAVTRQRGTMLAVILGSAVVFLDSTVVTVALPAIAADLRSDSVGTLEAQSYVYNGYLFSLATLLIVAGAVTDRTGRRRVFARGLVAFGITSALCGAAPSMETLIAARVLQGAAGAFLVPGSLSIITAAFEGEERGRAIGLWASASAATTILGPPIGGALVAAVSWRAVFFVNLPLVALAWWATTRHVAESRDPSVGRFDWRGAAVIGVAVGGLSFGLVRGQERAWNDPAAWTLLALGAVAAAAVPILMVRAPNPLVPPRLFRSRTFSVVNASTFIVYGALYVVTYILAIFLQGVVGYGPLAAGFALVPSSAVLAVLSGRFGVLAARHGPRRYLTAGPALMATGTALYTRIPSTSTPWDIRGNDPSTWLPPADYVTQMLPGTLIFGLGLAVMVAPLTTALMGSVPPQNAGIAAAFNNAVSRLGPQLIGGVVFVVISSGFYAGLASRVPGLDVTRADTRSLYAPLNEPGPGADPAAAGAARSASTDAFHLGMWVAAGTLLAGAAVNGLVAGREPGTRGDVATRPEAWPPGSRRPPTD